MVTPLEQFPLPHVVVERQQALQVDLGPGRALLDHDDKALGHTGNAVGTHIVGDVVDATHDEQFLGLSLDNGVDAVNHALHDVTHDTAVLDVAVIQQFVEFTTVSQAVAQHDDVLLADGQLVKERRTPCIVGILVGLGQGRKAHQHRHRQ